MSYFTKSSENHDRAYFWVLKVGVGIISVQCAWCVIYEKNHDRAYFWVLKVGVEIINVQYTGCVIYEKHV